MRKVIVMLEVDDSRTLDENLGTLDYVEREFGWLEESGIFLKTARILDEDDKKDAKAIELADMIFEEE
jgi:hypothetical protein